MNTKSIILVAALAVGSVLADDCWSTSLGYPCCKDKSTTVQFGANTSNQFGLENGQLCGITDIQLCPSGGEYRCCTGCEVIFTDDQDWGVENNDWCSIPYSCKADPNASSTTTTTTTTTTSKPSLLECAKAYYPCGGLQHPDAPTCCEAGYVCVERNANTHRCYPEEDYPELVSTTTTPTPTPTPTVCAKAYYPCGGLQHPEAPTCCEAGYVCVARNANTHRCYPEEDYPELVSTTTTTTTTTTTATSTSDGQCAKAYDMCGGNNYPDAPKCCEEGSICDTRYASFHQCIPESLYYGPPPPPPYGGQGGYPPPYGGQGGYPPQYYGGCARAFEWCGGNGYPNCCVSGYKCALSPQNRWQCLRDYDQPEPESKPGDPDYPYPYPRPEPASSTTKKSTTTKTTTKTTTTTTTTITTTTVTPIPTVVCAKGGDPCGGQLYPNAPTCCEEGYYCKYKSAYYHECAKLE